MKRTAVSVLILAALLAAVPSCGGETQPSADTDRTDNTEAAGETEAVTEEAGPALGLPAADYQNQEFRLLSSATFSYEFIDAESGDIVDDAVYRRSRSVEELLNIRMTVDIRPGDWTNRESFKSLIRNSILANDRDFSLVNSSCAVTLPLSMENLFLDVRELPYVDFSKPWWVQDLVDTVGINGKLYVFVGDASLSMYKNFAVMYFNQKMISDYDLMSPYEAVNQNNWTLETFHSLAKSVGNDVNGDGKIKETDDIFGYIFADVPNRTMQTAVEFRVVDLDDKNIPFVADLQDRDIEVYNKQYAFMKEYPYIYGIDTQDHAGFSAIFAGDRALFMCEFLTAAEYLRDMSSDFGIVPMPKYDAAQEKYHTQFATGASMFYVPVSVENLDLTSMVCEALSFYSYRDLIPTYYEVALKEKYSRDAEVRQMLDIVRSSAELTFAFTYATMFDPAPNTLFPNQNGGIQDIASHFEKNRKRWQSSLEKIVDSYAEME